MMTMEQFEEEKARLVELYGGTARGASGKRAQAFALLYAKSGWTQRAIAEVERLAQSHVHHLLVLGRFLISNRDQDIDCTEWSFRNLWNSTDKTATEEERFAVVTQGLLDKKADKPSKRLGKQLIAQFSDGKYHRISDMATALDVDMSAIRGSV